MGRAFLVAFTLLSVLCATYGNALAENLECQHQKASGSGPSPASRSENNEHCTMSFGDADKKTADELLGSILPNIGHEATQLEFISPEFRQLASQFNIDAKGSFTSAVAFLRILRLKGGITSTEAANNKSALDALVYLIAGSAVQNNKDVKAAYKNFLEQYWKARSTLPPAFSRPLSSISEIELATARLNSFKLQIGRGCLFASDGKNGFVAAITDFIWANRAGTDASCRGTLR